MKQADDILKELKELNSMLAEMPRSMPYEVPEGYFEGLHQDVLVGIQGGQEVLSVDIKEMPFEVPEGYFSTLPQQILFAALESDTTADMPKQMPYQAPVGYFDQLPGKMLEAIKNADAPAHPKTRTISLGRSLRWAAAAILLLGVGFTSYKVLSPDYTQPAEAISALPNNVIDEYVQQNFTEAALPEQTVASSNTSLSALDQLKEEDIVTYLDATGWDESLIN